MTRNSGDEMCESTHHEIAKQHVMQAGAHLRKFLDQEPRHIDNLDEWELALVKRVHGSSFVDRTMNRASQLDRIEQEAERVNRPDEQIKRVAFSMAEHRVIQPDEAGMREREFTR
jgi:hypothetical protein